MHLASVGGNGSEVIVTLRMDDSAVVATFQHWDDREVRQEIIGTCFGYDLTYKGDKLDGIYVLRLTQEADPIESRRKVPFDLREAEKLIGDAETFRAPILLDNRTQKGAWSFGLTWNKKRA